MSTRKKQWINCLGLGLGAIGAILVTICGFPQPNFNEGEPLDLEKGTVIDDKGTTVAQQDEARAKTRAIYARVSRTGLGLIVIAFGLQLWGSWPERLRPEEATA